MQEELEDYVRDPTRSGGIVPSATLLQLYSKLKPGLTVHDWHVLWHLSGSLGLMACELLRIEQNELHKLNVDVRRMLSFGVIKGFLRRVFVYPIWLQHPSLKPDRRRTGRHEAGATDLSRQSSASFGRLEARGKPTGATEARPAWPTELPLMLDGSVHTDALCVKWGVSQSQLDTWLRELGGEKLEVQFICI